MGTNVRSTNELCALRLLVLPIAFLITFVFFLPLSAPLESRAQQNPDPVPGDSVQRLLAWASSLFREDQALRNEWRMDERFPVLSEMVAELSAPGLRNPSLFWHLEYARFELGLLLVRDGQVLEGAELLRLVAEESRSHEVVRPVIAMYRLAVLQARALGDRARARELFTRIIELPHQGEYDPMVDVYRRAAQRQLNRMPRQEFVPSPRRPRP